METPQDADEKAGWRTSVGNDIAMSAQTGAPLIGCLSGLRRVTVAERPFALGLDLDRPALRGGPGIAEVAALADLTLGGAIRDAANRSLPLPTISMTLQLEAAAVRRTAIAAASAQAPRTSSGAAGADLMAIDGQIIGRAQGLFAVPTGSAVRSVPAMPWDRREIVRANADTFPPPEVLGASTGSVVSPAFDAALMAEQITSHARRSPATAWITSLVAENLTELAPGVAELPPIAASANRGGNIQGGLLFALAVLSNPSVHNFDSDQFATGTMEFLVPGSLIDPLRINTEVLRASRSTACCDVRIWQGDQLVARASTVFRC